MRSFRNAVASTYRSRAHRRALAISLAGCAIAGLAAYPAAAETRTYVVNWFTGASFNQDNDCEGGLDPDMNIQYRLDLAAVGFSKEKIEQLMAQLDEMGAKGNSREVYDAIINRGRIDGKPVDAYTNPAAVPDPHLHKVIGKFAYGFNLDGKGVTAPNGFEDPETHEKGVNNEGFRAMGCAAGLRGSAEQRPIQWAFTWDSLRAGMPAWLMTLDGADLSKDGDATLTFDRAREHITRDAVGGVQQDMTYRIDPDQRSHNVLHGKIKDGVFTLNQPTDFHMIGDLMLFPELRLRQMHMRLKVKPDGTLDGIMGGYQPWLDLFVYFGGGGQGAENNLGVDMPGIWHLLRNLADADPDPTTGRNKSISMAYRVEAVPAFLLPPSDGTRTASAP